MRTILQCLVFSALTFSAGSLSAATAPSTKGKVDFRRDIQPIISAKCFQCHGPDEAARKAKLRLDIREEALKDRKGTRAIVPGKLAQSEVWRRITTKDADDVMPPKKEGHPLTEPEIVLIRKWLEQGAPYAEHWAFTKPQLPSLPLVKNKQWPKNAVDHFILARLEKEGLKPAAPADRHTLIRRLSLDLTGLPPTPEQIEVFVNDHSSQAYEKLVDNLLASSAYGERWARVWLDLARYADSAGYGSDPLRLNIWPYRDWVISAFNRNLPYDRFTLEQIAGDLLPDATEEQLVATAFHRNTMTNTEGGTDDEEFRVAAVKDRIATTAQVWMGVTMGCAQCHTHKFDPITQREYYSFFALFNQTEDNDQPDERPTLPLATGEQRARLEKLKVDIAAVEKEIIAPAQLAAELAVWEQARSQGEGWVVLEPMEMKSAAGTTLQKLPDHSILAGGGSPDTDTYTISHRTSLKNITAVRLEVLPDEHLPKGGPGRGETGALTLNAFRLAVQPANAGVKKARFVRVELPGEQRLLSLAEVQVFSGGANVAIKGKASQSSTDYDGPAMLAIDGNTNGQYFEAKSTTHTKSEDNPWWEVDLGAEVAVDEIAVWNRTDGNVGTRLNNFKIRALDAARQPLFETAIATPPDPTTKVNLSGGQTVALQNASADFSEPNAGVEKAIDADPKSGWSIGGGTGRAHTAVFETTGSVGGDSANLVFTLDQTQGKQQTLGRLRLSATTQPRPVRELPESIRGILALAPRQRTEPQRAELAAYFRPLSPSFTKLNQQLAQLKNELAGIKPVPVPVMREMAKDKQRATRVLLKGNYLTPSDPVVAAFPKSFNPPPKDAPLNRLGVAQWLMSPDNPLTARVAVNRFWAQLFGVGIVETEEDFGTQGALPNHQELLDWLAVSFIAPSAGSGGSGLASRPQTPDANAQTLAQPWDMKALLKTLVMSATYQQSSLVAPDSARKDPRNQLLSHYPRRRLEAETVRDQALALSGLLSKKVGGPSVYPPQPDGLWRAAFNGERTWATSAGEDRYRRGLYTFWRRTVPYPSMATFDAPSRENCTMRRLPTNTPLQAFVTMNDPAFVEMAQALGRRMVKEGGASVTERARFGLRLALARPPTDEQVKALVSLYEKELENYRTNADAAKKLATEPLGPLPKDLDAAEAAAWTVVANVLLNLDAVLTKG